MGDVGLRGLQLARINTLELGTLKLRNVPCLIKDPPLRDLPVREAESLSPLSLGFSMIIDYKTKKITFGKHLPEEKSDFEMPLRLHRLATVRGTVDGTHAANFVVDTGGEVISISRATTATIRRGLFWAFVYNAAAVPLAAFGLLNPMWAGLAMAFAGVAWAFRDSGECARASWNADAEPDLGDLPGAEDLPVQYTCSPWPLNEKADVPVLKSASV